MGTGKPKRKRQYHRTPPSIDIRIKVWEGLRFLGQNAASGMATLVAYIVAVIGYLARFNPISLLARWLLAHATRKQPRRLLTYQHYHTVTYQPSLLERLRNTFKTDRATRRELLDWLKEKLPTGVGVEDFKDSWSNGVTLCALIEAVVPSTCPRYDLLKPENKVNNCRLGMTLVRKTLGIAEPMDPEVMANPSRIKESTLLQYVLSIKYASSVPLETPIDRKGPWSREGAWSQRQSDEVVDEERKKLMEADKIDCTASGSGLVMATVGKRAKFNVYTPRFITKSLHIYIKGPCGESVRRKIINHLPGGRPHRDDPESSNQSAASGVEETAASSSSNASPGGGVIPCEYQCVREGHYEVSYVPRSCGNHEITVTWGGEHVRNSPFTARASQADRHYPASDPAHPSRIVCFRDEKKRTELMGSLDIEGQDGREVGRPPPISSRDSSLHSEPDTVPNLKARARRRQSFCRQSHVNTLRESYESGGTASPYDSRCSSMLMSSTERSMDSDVFFPYGVGRAASFINSRHGPLLTSTSSSRSSMSHRSSSILGSGGDKSGTVRTRRKVIKRTIRGAGGKEEIQYPSSADISSMSGMSTTGLSFMGMSGMSSISTTYDQGSLYGSMSVCDDRLNRRISASASPSPSPMVVRPASGRTTPAGGIHRFADRTSRQLMDKVMQELSNRKDLETVDPEGVKSSNKSALDCTGIRRLADSANLTSMKKDSFQNKANESTHIAKDVPTTGSSDSKHNSRDTQSPTFLDVASVEGDGSSRQMEPQTTIEFEPQLGVDASKSAKDENSSSALTPSPQKDQTSDESGYSTLDDSLRTSRAANQGLQGDENGGKREFRPDDPGNGFEFRKQGFRPVKPVERHEAKGSIVASTIMEANEYLHAPKPQRHAPKMSAQSRRRKVNKQTQCTADDIKKETGWISRRSAFTKQKRREQTEVSFDRAPHNITASPETTTTSPALSVKSNESEPVVISRKRVPGKTPSLEKSLSGGSRQAGTQKRGSKSKSVARQATFDSGFSDENGHIYSIANRDPSHALPHSINAPGAFQANHQSDEKTKSVSQVNKDYTVGRAMVDTSELDDVFLKEEFPSVTKTDIRRGETETKFLVGDHQEGFAFKRKRTESASETARKIILSEKPDLKVEHLLDDREIIAATNRRPSFSAINFDLSHLHHVIGSHEIEQSPDRTPCVSQEIRDVLSVEQQPLAASNPPAGQPERSVEWNERRNDVTDLQDEAKPTSSTASNLQESCQPLRNEDIPVSKLLASLDNDPDFTIREFLSKFMPALNGDLITKDGGRLHPTLDALEQEMEASLTDIKSSITSRVGAETNSKKSSRRHTPRLGTPLSSGGQSSIDSHFSTVRPSCCQAMGIGIHEGIVGVKNNFQVETTNAGEGSLGVFIRGPRPHTVCETSVTFTGDDLYEVVYEVNLAGFYVISVKWNDKHIPDSPFIVNITF
ncbi:uncharacterized protein [Diadema setosum]|uniref:uncharacterized protein n=1 Tax=Diadema setosum TaxID=31175 RepID=UPI003B3B43BD